MDSKTMDKKDKLIFSIGVTAGFLAFVKELEIANNETLSLRNECSKLSFIVIDEIRKCGRINIENITIYCKELFKLYESILNINEMNFYNVKRKQIENISNRMESFYKAIKNISNIINT